MKPTKEMPGSASFRAFLRSAFIFSAGRAFLESVDQGRLGQKNSPHPLGLSYEQGQLYSDAVLPTFLLVMLHFDNDHVFKGLLTMVERMGRSQSRAYSTVILSKMVEL